MDNNENNVQNEDVTNNEQNLKENEDKGLWPEVFEWVQAIVVAVVIAMFLRTFVFTLVNVQGESMVPTLQNSDKLVVWRLGYTPKVGDVIIFRPRQHENTPYVKRVIAKAGQTVDIRENTQTGYCDVYIDDKKLEEDFINEKIKKVRKGTVKFPVTVPENCVFAMGDNRNNSLDSRFTEVGMVEDSSIIGEAVVRLWPINTMGTLR